MGKDDEFGLLAGLVGLERERVRTEPGGVVGNLVDVEDGDLAPAQGGHESDQPQGPVPGASHVRFRQTTTGLSPDSEAGGNDVDSYGGINGAACSDGAR